MPIFFCIIIIFCIWLTYERRKTTKTEEIAQETFLQLERKANRAMKKDISNLDYITIPINSLPVKQGLDDAINAYIESLFTLMEKPIVNLSKFSNTELKLEYGIANFERLSEYDENYYSLIRLLADWGCSLYETNRPEEAKQVLEYALSIGSDLKNPIYTLAKLYAEEENETGIHSIKTHISKHCPDRSEQMLLELEKIRYHQYFA